MAPGTAQGQDGTLRLTKNLGGHAPDHQPIQTSSAVGPHDDQVGADFEGQTQDLGRRRPSCTR